MKPIKTLEDRSKGKGILTPTLQRLYGGPLSFPNAPTDRPWTVVNFVTTMEGHTSFNIPGQEGGGEISGFNEQDTFIMGLLRATADAVMVGANTLRLEPNHLWTPSFISKEHATLFEALRKKLGKKSPNPRNMFVHFQERHSIPEYRVLAARCPWPGSSLSLPTSLRDKQPHWERSRGRRWRRDVGKKCSGHEEL